MRKLVATWLALLAMLRQWQPWAALALLTALHWGKWPLARWLISDEGFYDSARTGRIGLALALVFAIAVMVAHFALSRALARPKPAAPAGGQWLGLWFAMQLGGLILGGFLGYVFKSISPRFANSSLGQTIAATLALWPFFLPLLWATSLACGEARTSLKALITSLQPSLPYWLLGFAVICILSSLPIPALVASVFGGTSFNDDQSLNGQLCSAFLLSLGNVLPFLTAIAAYNTRARTDPATAQIFQ